MNRSPVYPRLETADYSGYEYDYQTDFTQFLEEARKNACQGASDTAQFQTSGIKQLDGGKKNRKSWKSSLFSWFNVDKKQNATKQPKNGITVPKQRRAHVSGPVQGTGGGKTSGRSSRPASGPLAGFFGSTRTVEEYKVPYMYLNKLSNPQKLPSYGPVYLVT